MPFRRYSGEAGGGENSCRWAGWALPPSAARDCRYPPTGAIGDRTPNMVSCPLLTPLTFLCADTSEMCSKRGLRGLGSVRRADFGTLLCPEFTLRELPRITVRGQTVQGVRLALRKAPLPSRIYPWSTKRPCGPLAFSRATEGRRGLKEGLGESRGGKGTIRCSFPLLPPVVGTASPGRRRRPLCTLTLSVKSPPAASRCIGGKVYHLLTV